MGETTQLSNNAHESTDIVLELLAYYGENTEMDSRIMYLILHDFSRI